MKNLSKFKYLIDHAGLVLMGLFSICYAYLSKSFAELHIQIAFLDFPIFIGEILIFLCLILVAMKCAFGGLQWRKWYLFILFYYIFVVGKAAYGYAHWGPLALRDSALFYYPIFFIFGFLFYQREFLKGGRLNLLVIMFLASFMTGKFPYYFALTWLVFSIVLISAYSSRYLQTFLFLFLIFFAPYKPLFDTARMLMAGNMIAFLYLLFALFLILRVRLKVKLIICFLLTCFLVVGFYKFPAKKRINTIVNLKSTWALYTASVEIIARKKGNFKVLTIPKIRLYNPEGIDFPLQGLSEEHADEFVTHAKINAEIIEPPESESVMKASENLEVLQNRAYRPKGVEIFLPEPEATKEHVREEEHNEGFLMEENASPEIIEAPENEFFAHRKNNFNAEEFPTQQALKATKKEIYRQFGTPVVRTNNTSNLSQQSLIDRSERVPMVSNSVFRLLIWRDMFANYMNEKPFLGFDFGKPFRSISLEVLNIAEGEWRRDGWISPHSSYLYMIYRGGIIGFIFVIGIFFLWFKMAQTFIRIRSVKGILLCASLISWLMAANFSHVFELPYTAIPIWSLYGVVFGYWRNKMSILKMSTAERPDIDA